jgi:hypothetical protein
VKARRVKGLDPSGPLADNVERIVRVRTDELFAFMPRAASPQEVEALHDMRIAAKRLRYILELTAPIFGPYAATAAKRAKELQDLLGEIHDCDVALPRLEALVRELRAADANAIHRAAGDAPDLEPALVAETEHAEAWRGMESLSIYLIARRRLLFERFGELWTGLNRDGFRARLEFAVSERARSQDGNRALTPQALASGTEDL